jgi:hypothetical protein
MYSLTYNSLTEIKTCQSVSKLTGSSKYRHIGTELIKRKHRQIPLEIGGNVYKKYLSALKFCDINQLPYNPEILKYYEPYGIEKAFDIIQYRNVSDGLRTSKGKTVRKYKLNKTKVRKKVSAMCRLDDSKNFLAFYSISFPVNAPDDVLYKIFNSWLTNCRKRYNLKTYLWVAERQGNNTLHFHMLTTNRMNIQEVNKAMAKSIDNEVRRGSLDWGNSSVEKYNGIDVDSPQHPKKRQNETRKQYRERLSKRNNVDKRQVIKWLSTYLTKYITKNDIEFNRLPWHCSRDVSALFTSIVISDSDIELYTEHLPDDAKNYKVIEKDGIIIYVFKFTPEEYLYHVLNWANNMIYNHLTKT